jgi:hypothetical protein
LSEAAAMAPEDRRAAWQSSLGNRVQRIHTEPCFGKVLVASLERTPSEIRGHHAQLPGAVILPGAAVEAKVHGGTCAQLSTCWCRHGKEPELAQVDVPDDDLSRGRDRCCRSRGLARIELAEGFGLSFASFKSLRQDARRTFDAALVTSPG